MHVITKGNRAPQLCVPRDCLYSQITLLPITVYIKIPIFVIKAAHHISLKAVTLLPAWISFNPIMDKLLH